MVKYITGGPSERFTVGRMKTLWIEHVVRQCETLFFGFGREKRSVSRRFNVSRVARLERQSGPLWDRFLVRDDCHGNDEGDTRGKCRRIES